MRMLMEEKLFWDSMRVVGIDPENYLIAQERKLHRLRDLRDVAPNHILFQLFGKPEQVLKALRTQKGYNLLRRKSRGIPHF